MVAKAVPTMSEEELAEWMANPMAGFEGPAPRKAAIHGTTAMYRRGCRCPGCKFRWSTYQRQYRERRRLRERAKL